MRFFGRLKTGLRKLADWYNALRAPTCGLLAFSGLFLGHLLTNPCGDYHRELCRELDLAVRPGRRLVGALPREHAKTTLGTVALTIRELCLGDKMNILLIAANREEASTKLRQIITELEENPRLGARFGDRLKPALDAKNQRVSYSDTEVVLGGGARVSVLGFGGKVRGQLSGGRRLDLVILDDPEDDQAVASADRRMKLRRWVDQALLNALDVEKGSLVWLGTLLHHDSVLAQWMASHDTQDNWRVIRKAALDDDNKPLWPERWSAKLLHRRRLEIGEKAFAQEYLNQPVSAMQQVFKPGELRSYAPDDLVLRGGECFIGAEPLSVVIGVDPAIGEGSQHDYFAAVVLGLAADKKIYVLHVERVKTRFSEQLEVIKRLAQTWCPRVIGVESIAYQVVLAQAAFDVGLPVAELKSNRPKLARIDAASVHCAQGRLYLPVTGHWVADFRREAADYPAGGHDDQLDALARALEIGLPLVEGQSAAIETAGPRRCNVAGFLS